VVGALGGGFGQKNACGRRLNVDLIETANLID
jgi:hypothetical protein